jgi:hypothetical protein
MSCHPNIFFKCQKSWSWSCLVSDELKFKNPDAFKILIIFLSHFFLTSYSCVKLNLTFKQWID